MGRKDELLTHLKKGIWVSGESISEVMAISRSAVWKHIRKLKEEGYEIESSPKKGYWLRKSPDRLLPHEIREGLDTRVFGQRKIIYLNETTSTNTVAKELAEKGAEEGVLVLAEHQTQGKGRKGRSWFSSPFESIYLSHILRPNIPPNEAPKMTLLVGVALAESILSITPLRPRIKWPNDILLGGKKVAGILTELSTELDKVDFIIVGLGLNINTPKFPHELENSATSIFIETGRRFSRLKLLKAYLQAFEHCYGVFREKGFSPILDRWKELSHIMGKRIRVRMIDQECEGRVLDIDQDGVLLIEDGEQKVHRIFSGDLTLLDPLSS